MFHPCCDSVDISLPESSAQSCTTTLLLQRDEAPSLPWFCPLASCPTNPLSIVSPEEPSPLSYTETIPVSHCSNPVSPPRSEAEPVALVSETTTGLGEAWDGHFSPTIVFQACPRRYIPVVVPCPPTGRRSISVTPQPDILGLFH
jgi:hypothetical protein